MKAKNFLKLLVLLVLLTLVLPVSVLAQQGEDLIEPQPPPDARPMRLGSIVETGESPIQERLAQIHAGENPPGGAAPQGGGDEGSYTLLDGLDAQQAESLLKPVPGMDGLERPDSCAQHILNGGFETNTAWNGSPLSHVSYSPYPFQGSRSLRMTTANRQTVYAWQAVTLPADATSIWVRLKAWEELDPGETAWVSVWNASNTQRLWYAQIIYTQGIWFDTYWWLPQPQGLAGQTVNLVFEMYHDGDSTHSDMWLDNVEIGTCTTPAPQTDPNTHVIDLSMSLWRTPSTGERTAYETIFKYAADAIYEMSNGRHFLGKITIYQNGQNYQNANVRWVRCVWPQVDQVGAVAAHVPGYLWMGDIWPKKTGLEDNPTYDCVNYEKYLLVQASWKQAGYIFAHEMGHYYYGLKDEYPLEDDDKSVLWSVMSSTYCGLSNTYCQNEGFSIQYPDPYYLHWLNFSHKGNFTTYNRQWRLYRASAWETLIRHPNYDPGQAFLYGKPLRTYYPELALVAPQPGQWSTIELPAGNITPCSVPSACSKLEVDWIPPASNRLEEISYTAQVYVKGGNAVVYPQPALLVAQVSHSSRIARAGLTTHVIAPNGAQSTLALKDDGVAPDYLANDGLYTGLLPYNQNGSYTVNVTFNNTTNQAVFTNIGNEDVTWQLGAAVGESFSATASATIEISEYAGDDHSDQFTNATALHSDNQPKSGRIDRAADKDLFKVTLVSDGLFVLRLSNFAQNMRPGIRLWSSDQQTLLGSYTIIPEPGYYYIIHINKPAGYTFYAEISHTNQQATQGIYEVSIGRPLAGEELYTAFIPLSQR